MCDFDVFCSFWEVLSKLSKPELAFVAFEFAPICFPLFNSFHPPWPRRTWWKTRRNSSSFRSQSAPRVVWPILPAYWIAFELYWAMKILAIFLRFIIQHHKPMSVIAIRIIDSRTYNIICYMLYVICYMLYVMYYILYLISCILYLIYFNIFYILHIIYIL